MKRLNHIVAIRRDVMLLVSVIADCVGIPHQVQPEHRHPLGIVRRRESLLDKLGTRRIPILLEGGSERLHVGHRRRQAREVERKSTSQRVRLRIRHGRQLLAGQSLSDESVNRCRSVRRDSIGGFGNGWQRLISPVSLPLGTLFDPLSDQRAFLLAERFAGLSRRHPFVNRIAHNPLPYRTGFELAGHNEFFRAVGLSHFMLEDAAARVEPQFRLPMLLIGAVTEDAFVGQDWSDVALEVDASGIGSPKCGRVSSGQ